MSSAVMPYSIKSGTGKKCTVCIPLSPRAPGEKRTEDEAPFLSTAPPRVVRNEREASQAATSDSSRSSSGHPETRICTCKSRQGKWWWSVQAHGHGQGRACALLAGTARRGGGLGAAAPLCEKQPEAKGIEKETDLCWLARCRIRSQPGRGPVGGVSCVIPVISQLQVMLSVSTSSHHIVGYASGRPTRGQSPHRSSRFLLSLCRFSRNEPRRSVQTPKPRKSPAVQAPAAHLGAAVADEREEIEGSPAKGKDTAALLLWFLGWRVFNHRHHRLTRRHHHHPPLAQVRHAPLTTGARAADARGRRSASDDRYQAA